MKNCLSVIKPNQERIENCVILRTYSHIGQCMKYVAYIIICSAFVDETNYFNQKALSKGLT